MLKTTIDFTGLTELINFIPSCTREITQSENATKIFFSKTGPDDRYSKWKLVWEHLVTWSTSRGSLKWSEESLMKI